MIEHFGNISAEVVKYTKNGEITYNIKSKEFTVWNETYSDTVCLTNYPKVAEEALRVYADYYI